MNARRIAGLALLVAVLIVAAGWAMSRADARGGNTDFEPCLDAQGHGARYCVWDARRMGTSTTDVSLAKRDWVREQITADRARTLLEQSGWRYDYESHSYVQGFGW